MRLPKALHGPLLALLGLGLGVAPATPTDTVADTVAAPASGVDPARIPATARQYLPLVTDLTAHECPELPPVWVVAAVEAESGWDPSATGAGVAGLLQFDELTWMAAGGSAWSSPAPRPGEPVTDAATHLRVAVPWLCSTLRAVEEHLTATGKPASPLDAMLVCHVAGCARVTGSATGVPHAGEAGCDARCAAVVARYLDAVHADVREYAVAPPDPRPPGPTPAAGASPPAGPPAGLRNPAAWTGGATGCTLPDPTGGRCVTGATRHGLDAAAAAFDGWHSGPAIHSAGCWDRHAWNPTSDHPQGRACDLFATAPGRFAAGAELADGWRVAQWFRDHAASLQVKYVIWQGRIWQPTVGDKDGWGSRYTGGGVYDVSTATGGHYDHVHVSFRE